MTRTPRGTLEVGYFYHLLNRGNNKNNIFKYSDDKKFFNDRFFYYLAEYSILPASFCIMNNHFHSLIYIEESSNLPDFMRALCTSYAMYFNLKYPHSGHVFQGRYVSKLIETETGVSNVYDYIRNNPVKAGYTKTPENYRWLWESRTVLDRALR